ncbi:MAG: hypothetical protein K2Q45_03255 [Nitrosomonas sp.]|nr:hypothetical protein [Nitrosomonas sp.]
MSFSDPPKIEKSDTFNIYEKTIMGRRKKHEDNSFWGVLRGWTLKYTKLSLKKKAGLLFLGCAILFVCLLLGTSSQQEVIKSKK